MTKPEEDYGVSQSTQWRLASMVQDSRMPDEDIIAEWLQYKIRYSLASRAKKDAYVECMEIVQYIKALKKEITVNSSRENKLITRDCIKEDYPSKYDKTNKEDCRKYEGMT